MIAIQLVEMLLGTLDLPSAKDLIEASVHLPRRGRRWIATFRDGSGRQLWKSTGLTDQRAALVLAYEWEKEARRKHTQHGDLPQKPSFRVRRGTGKSELGPFTEREVALILRISERAVREIQRRAIEKLRRHPALRALWREWETGDIDEAAHAGIGHLSQSEIAAIYRMARTPEEWRVLRKLIFAISA